MFNNKVAAAENTVEGKDDKPRRSIDSDSPLSSNMAMLSAGQTEEDHVFPPKKSREEDKQSPLTDVHVKTEAKKQKKMKLQEEKKLEKMEQELKKKLAYHQQDKADIDDSEQSICIAPPAPENRISVTKLVLCGVKGYKKCLIVCVVLEFITTAFLFGSVLAVKRLFPMGFAVEFRVNWDFIHLPSVTIVLAAGPIFTLCWLIVAIIVSTKSKICCCGHTSNWFLRGYYAYSSIFLIFPATTTFLIVMFVGRLSPESLEKVMFTHMNLYETNNISKEYWDETQKYFKCCGVDKDGWRNWENRDKVNEDVISWIVPTSCCRKQNKTQLTTCQNKTKASLVWKHGCLQDLYNLYDLYGNILLGALLSNIILKMIGIYLATSLYAAIREAAGQKISFHFVTYLVDCFTCCRRCKHVPAIA